MRFTSADAFLVPFSLMWGGFALFWEASVLVAGGPLFFALWGIPFVAMGLYFIFGRFVYKRRKKLRTAYGVTNDRAIVAVGDTSLTEMPIKQVATSQHRTRDGRHVSVTFGDVGRPWERVYGNTGMEVFGWGATPVAFYDVSEPDALLAALETGAGRVSRQSGQRSGHG